MTEEADQPLINYINFDGELFDDDGYPTDEACLVVEKWDDYKDVFGWFDFMKMLWNYPNYFNEEETEEGTTFYISTIGWSGNESVIGSAQHNWLMWSMYWETSRRGGHYTFFVNKKRPNGSNLNTES